MQEQVYLAANADITPHSRSRFAFCWDNTVTLLACHMPIGTDERSHVAIDCGKLIALTH